MNAVPERLENDKSKAPVLSRLEQMRKVRKDKNYEAPMPPVDAQYILDYFFEIGPLMAAGMSGGPITHEEMVAWQRNTGIELSSWQARFIRRLSSDYLGESQRAEKRDCKAPWQVEVVDKKIIAEDMKRQIQELAKL